MFGATVWFMSADAPETKIAPNRAVDTSALGRIARWLPFAMLGHFIIGVPALLISLVVAYGTFVQAGATQRMQQAAAWPFVAYGTGNYTSDGQRLINLSFANNGLGPALVGPVEVSYGGRAMRSPAELLAACCGYQDGRSMQLRTLPIVNVAVRPGEVVMFMSLPAVAANAGMVDRLDAVREAIKVRACYCSIFEDCWTVDGPQAQPQPVKACPTNWVVWQER
jgi:hypothetical protein